jgi:hypothetical protein
LKQGFKDVKIQGNHLLLVARPGVSGNSTERNVFDERTSEPSDEVLTEINATQMGRM